jgi:hypothetical protein
MIEIVISYRRKDSDAITGRIRDRLAQYFGEDAVFMDIDSVPIGEDFRRHIQGVVNHCKALVAVVGPNWTGYAGNAAARILDDSDPVRMEIVSAMQRGIPTIPVLVAGAQMPDVGQLPEDLKGFPFLNAVEVSAGVDFPYHIDRLIRALEQVVARPGGKFERAHRGVSIKPRLRIATIVILLCGLTALVSMAYLFTIRDFHLQSVKSGPPAATVADLIATPLNGDRVHALQGYPIIPNDVPTYAEGARISLTLAHNLSGPQKITVHNITPIVSFEAGVDPRLNYSISSGGVGGAGIATPRQFIVRLNGGEGITAAWIDESGNRRVASSANLLDTQPPLLLTLDTRDSTESLDISIYAMKAGKYKVALEIYFAVGALNKQFKTESIQIYRR